MTIRVLDCDQTFDVLTRGPFPSGDAEDGAVEDHLRTCHECRQLAEALRPAVDLIHESLNEPNLPGYDGSLPESDPDAVEAVMDLVRSEPLVALSSKRAPRWDLLSVVIAGVVGFLLGMFLANPAERFSSPGASFAHAAARDPGPEGLALLENLNLVAQCRTEPTEVNPAIVTEPTELAFACCTECHQPDATLRLHHETQLTRLFQGCGACHRIEG